MMVSRTSLQRNTPPATKDTHLAVPDTHDTNFGVLDTQTVGVNPPALEPEVASVSIVQDPGQRNPLASSG